MDQHEHRPFGSPEEVALYRRAVARFATGVCVVTTMFEGMDHAMTANAFTSVSLEPVLVLVCVEQEARFHEAITASGSWAVSILDAHGRAASTWLATRGRPLFGQLDQVPHRRGVASGAALLDNAVSWLECRTTSLVAAGDHTIVIGEVIGCELGPDDAKSLIYHRGQYGVLD